MSDRYPGRERKQTERGAAAAADASERVAEKQANKIAKHRRGIIIEAQEARIKAEVLAKQHVRHTLHVPKRVVEEAERDAKEKEESRDALLKAEIAAAAAGHKGGARKTHRRRRSMRRKVGTTVRTVRATHRRHH
jgi:hypothetical protein